MDLPNMIIISFENWLWIKSLNNLLLIIFKNLKEISNGLTDTGRKFVNVLKLLISFSHKFSYIRGTALKIYITEYPFSEQIIVLHRIDHSVHTLRLWALQETSYIAHSWQLKVFFLIMNGDIFNCVEVLTHLQVRFFSIRKFISI